MIDTHAHLNFEKFEGEVAAVISRAKAVGIRRFIVPSSNLETSKKAIHLSHRHPEISAAIGLHPIHASELTIEAFQRFYSLASQPKVVAIGEIGLDYFYLNKTSEYAHYPSKEEQRAVLVQFLKLAKDANLPIILHCREAYPDLLNLLKGEGVSGGGVIHCFMGSLEEAEAFLKMGFCLSFAGNITYSGKLDEVVRVVPLERLLLETDAPYLAPEPYRGKRNEPAFMVETAQKIAQLKGISLAELEKQTDQNVERLFSLRKEEE